MSPWLDRGYPGFDLRVWRSGREVYAGQVGYRDPAAGTPLGRDTIYRVYSMTKPVVSTALMLLHAEGRFLLNDPVAAYLPGFADARVLTHGRLEAPARPMRVRDLLTMTCGLTYDFAIDNPVAGFYRDARLSADPGRSLERMVATLADIPLAYHPGERWHYGLGIDVAAHLIEVLSDQPLADLLHERLFAPLGMHDTAFSVRSSERHRLAPMYGHPDLFGPGTTLLDVAEAAASHDVDRRDVDRTYPADSADLFQRGGVGLFSTAEDYGSFAGMLLTGRSRNGEPIVDPRTLRLMHRNHLSPDLLGPYQIGGAGREGWGYGFGSRVAVDLARMGELGSDGEFGWGGAGGTYYWVDPREDLVAVMMSQFMARLDTPEQTFRNLVYTGLDDLRDGPVRNIR